MQPIDRVRFSRIKPSFVTRRVDHGHIAVLDPDAQDLKPGDLVLARVEEIGQHMRIERPDGRRSLLFPGDEILVACGARYAPDQFEADCPTAVGPAHLAAAGGIAGLVRMRHERMKPATRIAIDAAVCTDDGSRINLARYGVTAAMKPVRVPVLAVCGTSMNAGKTHTTASLVRGLAATGRNVAAIKATGTGAGGDLWFFKDAGAHYACDFTDAGFATTYRLPVDDIFAGMRRLIAEAEAAGAEVVVMEVADGLLQGETAELLRMEAFRSILTGLVFAANDAMGAEAGAAWLRAAGLPLRAISGCLTQSPLAMREVASTIDLPCLTPIDLQQAGVVARLADAPCTVNVLTAV